MVMVEGQSVGNHDDELSNSGANPVGENHAEEVSVQQFHEVDDIFPTYSFFPTNTI
jgi:hypothetical protein